MPTTYEWRGDAVAIAQVDHFTPGSVSIGDTFTITINGKDVTFTATAATVQNVCDGLQPLLSASTHPEFQEIEWTEDNAKIIGTSRLAGRPFTATGSSVGGTLSRTASTANSSPNDVANSANFSPSGNPGAGDTVIVRGGADWLYGLDQSSAGTWARLIWSRGAETKLGLRRFNPAGYREYRETHLKVNVSQVDVGLALSDGSRGTSRFNINTLATQTAMLVHYTGGSEASGSGAVNWFGEHSSNVVDVSFGSVDVGVDGDAEVGIFTVSDTGHQFNTIVNVGLFTTGIGIFQQTGGRSSLSVAPTAVIVTGGECSIANGTITAMRIEQRAIVYCSANATTVTISAALDTSRSTTTKTFTNCTIHKGAAINDPNGTIVFTNDCEMSGCTFHEVHLNFGQNRAFNVS